MGTRCSFVRCLSIFKPLSRSRWLAGDRHSSTPLRGPRASRTHPPAFFSRRSIRWPRRRQRRWWCKNDSSRITTTSKRSQPAERSGRWQEKSQKIFVVDRDSAKKGMLGGKPVRTGTTSLCSTTHSGSEGVPRTALSYKWTVKTPSAHVSIRQLGECLAGIF